MQPGDLIRVHRDDEYGSEERKRFEPCFVGSLDQDGLLESLVSFGPTIMNGCKGAQGLKLLVSLGRIPTNLSAVQPLTGCCPESSSGGAGI